MVAAKRKKTVGPHSAAAAELPPFTVSSAPANVPSPYLTVTVRAVVTEKNMVPVFEAISNEIKRQDFRRALVDLRESSVSLSLSDIFGVAKMTAATFSGVLQKLALLVRPRDLLNEKFFEPSVSSRGVPTFVTSDAAEAEYWITSKTKVLR